MRLPRKAGLEPTYKLAMAAGQDAGNRSMKKGGRTAWSAEDYRAAAETARKILGKGDDV